MRNLLAALCLLVPLSPLALSSVAFAQQEPITTLRSAPLAENASPPRMAPQSNTDLRQVRNYPEQPPLIPHKIEGYQVDLNTNKCMTCHARSAIGDSQAPMVSITHFMDRDGQFLASISPRRYFCNQCHVPQTETKPMVENTFVDVDSVIEFLKTKK